ncbi:MAG TPA: hypothetical protein VK638_21710, partial [Edaphobacter sp.]|nr:hypothetical protein [Edaphobacter sp.]
TSPSRLRGAKPSLLRLLFARPRGGVCLPATLALLLFVNRTPNRGQHVRWNCCDTVVSLRVLSRLLQNFVFVLTLGHETAPRIQVTALKHLHVAPPTI